MHRRGPMMDHWRKVNEMAKATQTDLSKAFDDGTLSSEQWAKMVSVCQGCTWVAGCKDWLATEQDAYRPPHDCPNRARFAVLKSAQESEDA